MTTTLRSLTPWVLVIGTMLASGAVAQDRRDASALVREAQALLLAAYPELRNARVSWRVDHTINGVALEARGLIAPEQDRAAPSMPLVGATVVADERGTLQGLRTRGRLVDDARQRLAGVASTGRSAEEILTAADAKYPPSNPSALATLVPAGIPRALRASVRDRMFRETVADAADEVLTWRVELDTADHAYTLVFEPVEGRLLSVVRR